MTLKEFLRNKTQMHELCAIRDHGYIVATVWIDSEDLWRIPQDYANCKVVRDTWGTLPVVRQTNNVVDYAPCHCIDVE